MAIAFSGFLYDDGGVAINGATINLYDRTDTTTSRANTTTNSSGYWAVSHGTQGRFDVELAYGTSTRRLKYDTSQQYDFLEVANFRIRNPANTFEYDIIPAAITSQLNLTLPLITGNDTLPAIGLAQTWTATQSFGANADIAFTGGTGTNDIVLTDSLADALSITSGGTNDVLVIDTSTSGNVITASSALTVGVSDAGHDVKFFGATANTYMLWDESTDDLVLTLGAELYLYDAAGGEHIKSDGTDMTIYAGTDLNLTAGTDINIPADVGLTFGNDAEKIEGDGTDLTIAGNNINLTAVADVVVPANVGITFGSGEKIEGDSTDLTITSGAKINLTAASDVVIPANVGITFGSGEKIEGDSTDLTVTSGAKINLTATSDVVIPSSVGLILDGSGSEKIESDGTDISISVGSSGDINIPANIGVTFGDDGEKIEGDGTDLTISGNIVNLSGAVTASSTLAVSGLISANGGITFAAGDDIAFTGGTGTNDITLANSLADALSITRAGTDMMVFDSNTPRITITPVVTITGIATLASSSTIGNLTLGDGSIVDSSGAISFGNENLSTTGTLASGALTVTGDVIANGRFGLGKTISEVTISSGVVTVTDWMHTIDTEGAGAGDSTDDLDTINGGSIGDILFLFSASSARDVTLKNGTGNIYTRDGADLTMTSTITPLMLVFDNGSTWRVVAGQAGL